MFIIEKNIPHIQQELRIKMRKYLQTKSKYLPNPNPTLQGYDIQFPSQLKSTTLSAYNV